MFNKLDLHSIRNMSCGETIFEFLQRVIIVIILCINKASAIELFHVLLFDTTIVASMEHMAAKYLWFREEKKLTLNRINKKNQCRR